MGIRETSTTCTSHTLSATDTPNWSIDLFSIHLEKKLKYFSHIKIPYQSTR